jgi:RNA polymerase sigma-70 factor (ECF subfamily)
MRTAGPVGTDGWLQQVLARHERPLLGYAARLLGDVEAARDVVQDAFLRLCREPIGLEDARLGPWLYRVCRNRAIDHLRKESRMQRLDEAFAPPETADGPHEAAARREASERLVLLLQGLPPRQQEMVWLRFRSGLSYREIAEVCRTSVGNVGVMLHTALRTLKTRLETASPLAAKEPS